jgi:predicted flap endonuclease-1-like 5' DNA nuclease
MYLLSQIVIIIVIAAALGALVCHVFHLCANNSEDLRKQIKALSTERDELIWNLEVRAGPDAHTVASSRRIVALEKELVHIRSRADALAAANAKLVASQHQSGDGTHQAPDGLVPVGSRVAPTYLATLSPEALAEAVKMAGAGTPPPRLTAPADPDDLALIAGIGPMNRAWLHAQGIYSFRQIADLTLEELAWLAKNMPAFGARVYRENWVAQASKLAGELS